MAEASAAEGCGKGSWMRIVCGSWVDLEWSRCAQVRPSIWRKIPNKPHKSPHPGAIRVPWIQTQMQKLEHGAQRVSVGHSMIQLRCRMQHRPSSFSKGRHPNRRGPRRRSLVFTCSQHASGRGSAAHASWPGSMAATWLPSAGFRISVLTSFSS